MRLPRRYFVSLSVEDICIDQLMRIGQRLQAMRKEENPNAQVDILASMNAAEHERDEAVNGEESDDE